MNVAGLRTIKVIVGGEGNVGKTSLVRRYARAKFSEARNITLGMDITTQEFQLGDARYKLAIWDIEGQAGDRPNFYLGAQAALLVYDMTAPASLDALRTWAERVERFAPGVPLLVAGNKADLPPALPEARGEALAKAVGARGHVWLSAKTDTNVAPTFRWLAELAVAHLLAEDEEVDASAT